MNGKQEIKELCEGLGWIDLGAQKNPKMISFKQEESGRRVNIYFTTMSVSCVDKVGVQRHYRGVDLEQLEKIMTE